MKLTTKLLVPAAFVLASTAASASVLNIDYPQGKLEATGAAQAEQGAMVGIGGTLSIMNNNSPVTAKQFSTDVPTRAEVQREAERNPLMFRDSRYFQ